MGRYETAKCPVCNKPFEEHEDIVVCPICGAPHHRECYRKLGHCSFEAEHASGKTWSAPQEDSFKNEYHTNQTNGLKRCPRCGAENTEMAIFCNVCGTKLNDNAQNPENPYVGNAQGYYQDPNRGANFGGAPFGGFGGFGAFTQDNRVERPDPTQPLTEDITIGEACAFIGPNTAYFLPHFQRFSQTKRKFSFNFSAFFFHFFYFFYRKMYSVGVILLAFFLISWIPTFIGSIEMVKQVMMEYGMPVASQVNQQLLETATFWQGLFSVFQFMINIFIGIFANYIYYTHMQKTVKMIRQETQQALTTQDYISLLGSKGSVSSKVTLGIGIGVVSLYFVIAIISSILIVLPS